MDLLGGTACEAKVRFHKGASALLIFSRNLLRGFPLPIHPALGGAYKSLMGPIEYAFKLTFPDRSNFSIYASLAEEYSSRELTFEEDVLDGLHALSTIISANLFLGSPIIFGIPIYIPRYILGMANLRRWVNDLSGFEPRSKSRERFPTWSWVGWVDQVKFWGLLMNPCQNPSRALTTRAKWYYRSNDLGPLNLECTGWPAASWPGCKDWQSVSLRNDIYFQCNRDTRKAIFCHPVEVNVQLTTPELTHIGSTILQLEAEVTVFLLEILSASIKDKHAARLAILDTGGFICCQIWHDEERRDRFVGLESLIKLS
jgi:hypothetical protein